MQASRDWVTAAYMARDNRPLRRHYETANAITGEHERHVAKDGSALPPVSVTQDRIALALLMELRLGREQARQGCADTIRRAADELHQRARDMGGA